MIPLYAVRREFCELLLDASSVPLLPAGIVFVAVVFFVVDLFWGQAVAAFTIALFFDTIVGLGGRRILWFLGCCCLDKN